MTPDAGRLVPAVVRFRLKQPEGDLSEFASFAAQLYQHGYILISPREIWRGESDRSTLELSCVFWDAQAPVQALQDPRLRAMFAPGGILHDRLAGEPAVTPREDPVLVSDDVRSCACAARPFLVLRGGTFLPHEGGFSCPRCEAPVAPYRLPREASAVDWTSLSADIFRIWLASGALEAWAFRELSHSISDLNQAADRLVQQASRALGQPVYREIFTETGYSPSCPACGQQGADPELEGVRWRVCAGCRTAWLAEPHAFE